MIAGACASAAANIVEAHIFTTTDGFALDSIFISREFAQDADEIRRGRRIADTVEKSLRGEVRLRDIIQDRRQREERAKTFAVEPEVEIDNYAFRSLHGAADFRARPARVCCTT